MIFLTRASRFASSFPLLARQTSMTWSTRFSDTMRSHPNTMPRAVTLLFRACFPRNRHRDHPCKLLMLNASLPAFRAFLCRSRTCSEIHKNTSTTSRLNCPTSFALAATSSFQRDPTSLCTCKLEAMTRHASWSNRFFTKRAFARIDLRTSFASPPSEFTSRRRGCNRYFHVRHRLLTRQRYVIWVCDLVMLRVLLRLVLFFLLLWLLLLSFISCFDVFNEYCFPPWCDLLHYVFFH